MSEKSKYHSEEYIDAYLLNRLSKDEQEAFEKAMAQDENLRSQVEEHRKLIKGIEQAGNENLKARFSRLDKDQQSRKTVSLRTVAAIAASLLILVVAGYFIYQVSSDSNPNQIYASHFEPYPVIEQGTTRGENGSSQLEQGLQAYEQGQYAEAIDLLEDYLEADPDNAFVQFYLGLSYLSDDQANQALKYFQSISKTKNFKLADQAKWYLGLAYLKTGKKSEASDIFHHLQMESKDPSIRQKAEGILPDL